SAGNVAGISAKDFPPAVNQLANDFLNGGSLLPIPGTALSSTGFSISNHFPQPYYTYTCYDQHKEVLARIRLMVRSWDNLNQINSATSYAPNYAQEGGVGDNAPNHDFLMWGDLFFNYTDTASVAVRKSWANSGAVAACGTTPSISSTYATPPCRNSTSAGISYKDGFPQMLE
ncbi:MAG: hypothetical protein JWP08_2587, partial [Bryobacterales bacterium]|nr:hypothetical protein [Bryobacterales bacterium]